MKIVIGAKIYNKLLAVFEQEEIRAKGDKVWLDAGYYILFDRWLENNYKCKCISHSSELVFEHEKDAMMFLLRWS